MWTIPAEREPLPGVNFSHRGSKMRTPHLVPLSKQAVAILTELQTWAGENGLVLTGAHDPHKPISENTVNKALRVMGYDTTQDICGHGFRTMACSALIESGLGILCFCLIGRTSILIRRTLFWKITKPLKTVLNCLVRGG